MDLMDGDQCGALLLSYFEHLTTIESGRIEDEDGIDDPWLKLPMPAIYEGLLRSYSVRSIQERVDLLERNNLLQWREEFRGSVRRYLFNYRRVQEMLDCKSVIRTDSVPPAKLPETPAEPSAEPSAKLPEVGGVLNLKEVISNTQHLPPPPQDFCPEYESTSGSRRWEESDIKTFFGKYKHGRGVQKPDKRERIRTMDFFNDNNIGPDAALQAIGGYLASEFDRHPLFEFRRNFYQYLDAANRSDQDSTQASSPGKQTAIDPRALEPPAKAFLPAEAIAKWNELVPSNPMNDWDWANDDVRAAEKACNNQVFVNRFDDICRKAEAVAKEGDLSRDFRWMIKSYGAKPGNWWDFLTSKPRPKRKPEEKTDMIATGLKQLLEKSRSK